MADLLKTAALYRAVMVASFDPFVTIDSQGIIQAASDSLETVFGWKPEEAVGQNIKILMPEPYRSKHDEYLAEYHRTGRARLLGMARQLEAVRKDGSLFPCEISVFRVDVPDGETPLFAGILRDITSARLDEQLRLSNHAAELEKRNEDLLSLNLQLEDVRETLNEALAKADAANKAKTSFLANMSHEIRTPMNAIIGFSRRLLGESLTEDQLRKARFINEAAIQLLALLNDVLDISKIEAGRLELCVEKMNLHNVARHAVETIKSLAGEKGVAVEFRLDENVPQWVNGDAGRLRQVLLNLLGNAVKFTESGSIQLDVRLDSENVEAVTVRVEVVDSGVGVPKDRQDAIFNRFTQADESTTRKFGGTGLGLAICKRLVEIMEGTIGVESEEGEGSTFYFTAVLPKHVSHDSDPTAPIAASTRRPEADAAPAHAPAPRRPRILYAEDSELNQRLVVEILKCAGMDVSLANDGKEALAALERDSYDLVLMDVQMPEMDGIEATRRIRQHEATSGRHVPIVALTAFAMSGDRDRCLSAGMDDYATKPIDQDELVSKVTQYLEKANVLAPEPLAACSNEG